MKRLFLLAVIACAVLTLPTSSVLAASNPPSNDAYARSTATGTTFGTTDPNTLSVVGSTTSCNATDITYLQWDLSSIPTGQTVGSASLTLTASTVSSAGSATLGLYSVPGTWTEGALNWSNAPGLPLAPAALLDSKPAPTAGNSVTFSGAALTNYLNTGTGAPGPGRKASFALAFTAGCSNSVSVALFSSKDSAGTKPDLQWLSPTAVTLQSFGGAGMVSAGAALPWGGVLALVGVLIVLVRRRFSPIS